MNKKGRINKNIKAFTLVELMVSMLVLSIVMLGVFGLFASQQQNYRSTSDLARSQYNLRIAMFTIAKDIRNTGYTGIPLGIDRAIPPSVNPIFPLAPVEKNGSQDISFLDVKTRTLDSSSATGSVDAIDLWANFTMQISVPVNDVYPGNSSFQVGNPEIFIAPSGSPVAQIIIGDEDHVEVHDVRNFNYTEGEDNGTITLSQPILNTYYVGTDPTMPQTVIAPLIHRRYFLDTRTGVSAGNTVRTLVRRDYYSGGFEDQEVASNIDNLQISYTMADPVRDPGTGNIVATTMKTFRDIDPERSDVPGTDLDPLQNPWLIRGLSVNLTSASMPRRGETSSTGDPLLVFTNMSQMIKIRNVGLQRLQ